MNADPSPPSSVYRRPSTTSLEKAVIAHLGVLLIFTSWAFGGQAPWARQVIAGWGGVGVLLFFVACRNYPKSTERLHLAVRWLWPLMLFDLFVGVSGFNPSFSEVVRDSETSLVMSHPSLWLPSSARPVVTWTELWQLNVIVLSCFNLILVIQSRKTLRMVLGIIGANAVGLAVFGTFQKLSGSSGLWFGLVPSPNPKFFATFIYHNHWGAFTVLNTAVCLGLLDHFVRRSTPRGLWYSPAPLGVLAILLLAATIPLSASRSGTLLMAILLGGALVHQLVRVMRHRRTHHQSAAAPVAGIVLAAALALGAIFYLGHEVIAQRAQVTSEQLASIAREDTLNSRLTLYRDTWRMAAEKPWFGWGLESYAHVFRVFNTQRAAETWVGMPFYAEAHSDWLQSLAEVGFVGTGLLALLIFLPLFSLRWDKIDSHLPRYLLAGVALILLYAWVEFPFANPAVMITSCATFYCAIRYATLALRNAPEKAP